MTVQEIEITKSGKPKGGKKAAKGAAAARALASRLRRSSATGASPRAAGGDFNSIESAGESSSPPTLVVGGGKANNSTSQTQVSLCVPVNVSVTCSFDNALGLKMKPACLILKQLSNLCIRCTSLLRNLLHKRQKEKEFQGACQILQISILPGLWVLPYITHLITSFLCMKCS
jgi:hypothetical protein